MKIAHILWDFEIGGIQTMLVDIANEQVKTEQVCVVLINDCYNPALLAKLDGRIFIKKIGRMPGSKNPLPILKLNAFLLWWDPDVIHCHDHSQNKLIVQKSKMVRTIHNTHSNCKDYKDFKRLFCISNEVKRYTSEQGYKDGIVVYNGIHTSLVKSSPEGIFKDGNKHLICVGRLYPDKGQIVLLKAIDELVNKRNVHDFQLDLIGDGESRQELEEYVSRHNLNSNVSFLGSKPREEFYKLLCEYDLFILPSVSEGFGLTLAEACSAKLPVVSCDLAGPLEVIEGGRLGVTFKCGDHLDLANKIMSFLQTGTDMEKVESAYQFVKANFDVKSTATRYIDEYKKFINAR